MKDNTNAPKKWNHIQCDLQNALSTWADLTLKTQGQIDPNQEQMQKMRQIIFEIRSQLEAFSNDIPATATEPCSVEPSTRQE